MSQEVVWMLGWLGLFPPKYDPARLFEQLILIRMKFPNEQLLAIACVSTAENIAYSRKECTATVLS